MHSVFVLLALALPRTSTRLRPPLTRAVVSAASRPVPFGRPSPGKPKPPPSFVSTCKVPTLPSPLAPPAGTLVQAALGVGVQVRSRCVRMV